MVQNYLPLVAHYILSVLIITFTEPFCFHCQVWDSVCSRYCQNTIAWPVKPFPNCFSFCQLRMKHFKYIPLQVSVCWIKMCYFFTVQSENLAFSQIIFLFLLLISLFPPHLHFLISLPLPLLSRSLHSHLYLNGKASHISSASAAASKLCQRSCVTSSGYSTFVRKWKFYVHVFCMAEL